MNSTQLVVAAAILHRGQCLVALQERHGEVSWEFPGGKVEPGEDPRDALRREILEELAMGIDVHEAVAETDVVVGPAVFRVRLYRTSWLGGGPTLNEHSRIDWLSPDELGGVDWHEADARLQQSLTRHLQNRST